MGRRPYRRPATDPEQDAMVLDFGIGLTDVVKGRASSSDALLRASDYDVPGFTAKIESHKPFVVAFNGKQAAREFSGLSAKVSLGSDSWTGGLGTPTFTCSPLVLDLAPIHRTTRRRLRKRSGGKSSARG